MDPVWFARETLAGRVNDWPEHARRNAETVIRLVEHHADELAAARVAAASAVFRADAADAVRAAASAASAEAKEKAEKAELERDEARQKLRHLSTLVEQLLGRVVEDRFGHKLAEHSGPQLKKLREAVGDAEV